MSIVTLHRVSFAGLIGDKEILLDDLHRFGVLEIIPSGQVAKGAAGHASSDRSREALKFLLSAPQRRRQVQNYETFDPHVVEQKALELQDRIATLEAERDDLLQRLDAAKPFGKFRFVPKEQMGDLRLWFYAVPHANIAQVDAAVAETSVRVAAASEIVARDPQCCYVVVVSPVEVPKMPVPRARIGSTGPHEMSRRLDEVELAIEDAQSDRASLTRWCLLFARNLTALQDAAARADADRQTFDTDPVFALEAWVPELHVDELARYAHKNGFVFSNRPPTPEESPPTLMRNTPRVEAGEDLVNFYMTPGYWTWDPSGIVFISFAIFFAMILADAGYATVLGLMLLVVWRKLGRPNTTDAIFANAADIEQGEPLPERTTGQRFRPVLLMIVLSSMIYGVMVGSYFGLTPSTDSVLGYLHVLDINDSHLMMGVAVFVGALHVVLANIMDARRYQDWRDGLSSFGWAAAVGGGLLFAAGTAIPLVAGLKLIGVLVGIAGLLLVLLYTARHEKPLKRLLGGLLGLTKVSAAFGDVLSYLRLFALGLASASLATAFNDMASGIYSSMPRFGLIAALLVLLFGHALNLLLGVSSGVIHGLRLNVIEFFNWGLKDEGRRFTPFRRKEGSLWN
ncbi:V-type ATP synthase subunit I [Roseiconus lacunae]|uniref:V-type ATP synthase subunit I n=1 Tax=Roseiconus lacunae TaxID=2605694 RepID=UPI0011F0DA67|nr:ATPase V [Roseiconus lacunae]